MPRLRKRSEVVQGEQRCNEAHNVFGDAIGQPTFLFNGRQIVLDTKGKVLLAERREDVQAVERFIERLNKELFPARK